MEFFNEVNMCPLFKMMEACQGVEQNPEWHPEGDVFNHLLQSTLIALRETQDIDLILAAMFHDVGKAEDSKNHV